MTDTVVVGEGVQTENLETPSESQCQASIPLSSQGLSPFIEGTARYIQGYPNPSASGTRTLFCDYYLSRFDQVPQMDEWLKSFQADDYDAFLVMREVCSGTDDGKQTRVFTNDTCRQWYTSIPDPDRDNAADYICQKHPFFEECRCMQRNLDPIYNTIRKYQWGSDTCWWRPCKEPATHHVPSTMVVPEECPQACRTILDVAGTIDGDLNITDWQQSVDCDFSDAANATYRCISGDCRQSTCSPDEVNCYKTADCEGHCKQRVGWMCQRSGDCRQEMCTGSECYDSAERCLENCRREVIEPYDWTPWIVIGAIAGFVALTGLTYLIYSKIKRP